MQSQSVGRAEIDGVMMAPFCSKDRPNPPIPPPLAQRKMTICVAPKSIREGDISSLREQSIRSFWAPSMCARGVVIPLQRNHSTNSEQIRCNESIPRAVKSPLKRTHPFVCILGKGREGGLDGQPLDLRGQEVVTSTSTSTCQTISSSIPHCPRGPLYAHQEPIRSTAI